MAPGYVGKLSIKDKGLHYKLSIINALLFVMPVLILSYMFYRNNVLLARSQIVIFALTLVLILSGLIMLRQIFDRFSMIAASIKGAENGEKGLIEIHQDTAEFHEMTTSFHNLMDRFEDTAAELQRRVFELFAIKGLVEVASKSPNIDDLLDLLLEKAVDVSNAEGGSVYMVEYEKKRFRVAATRGLESALKEGSCINIKDSYARFVVSDRKSLLIQDVEADSSAQSTNDSKNEFPSLLSMPIFLSDKVMAVLNLWSREEKEIFDSNIEQILSIMIGGICFALENAHLHAQVVEHVKQLKERTLELSNANDQLQHEIVERKQAEEALRIKDSAIESSINAIALADLEGILQYVNPSFIELWGYAGKAEVLGRPIVEFWEAEERAAGVIEALRDKGDWIGDLIAKTKKGTAFNVHLSASLVTDENGDPICMMASFIDITEQKRSEQEKNILEAQLQRAHKREAIGALAGGVAHDLNNILAGLVSYPDLLLMEMPEDSPLREPVLTIQRSGEKAAAIVQDLLTLARRGVSTTEVLNLNHIISDYLRSPEFEKLRSFHPGVRVHTELELDLLNLLGSFAHLSKTVMNLVSNAAEAMSDGGEITITTENRYIDTPVSGYDNIDEGDYVTLQVSDTGVGISPEDKEKIFEPFYTKKVMRRSGTGLGMSVVWGTVKDHRGYIDVQSAEAKGTTFTLYFPATREEVTTDTPPLSIEKYRGRGESILIVDDVEEQREIATSMLERLGYSVRSASSGEEAVKYLRDHSSDLLVLDMIMNHGMDGLETYKRILEVHPQQKAIIASGFSETQRVKEAQRLGAGAYIKKPYLLEKIGISVRAELER